MILEVDDEVGVDVRRLVDRMVNDDAAVEPRLNVTVIREWGIGRCRQYPLAKVSHRHHRLSVAS